MQFYQEAPYLINSCPLNVICIVASSLKQLFLAYSFLRATANRTVMVFALSLSSLQGLRGRTMKAFVACEDSMDVQYVVTNVQRSTGASSNSLNMLETLFAGLSVLVGSLALVIGLLQLLKWQRRCRVSRRSSIYELEATLPEVSIDSSVEHCSSLIR